MSTRRRAGAVAASALLTPLFAVPLSAPATAADAPLAASMAVDWQRTAARTAFVERGSAPPLGGLYLAFTSLAVHDAAVEARPHGPHAAAAAVAVAAHDVLLEYFADSATGLQADLTASLARIPDGHGQTTGMAIGAAAADEMIASRVDDGRGDASYVYAKPPGLGVWQPAPGGAMALAWLGFVDPLVDGLTPVAVDGPDPLGSGAYASHYEEVRRLGAADSKTRSPRRTAIAQFFSANPVLMYRNALCELLDAEPMALLATTRLFARIDVAVTTAQIQNWRLKYEVGFWRPAEAIAAGAVDGNDRTRPHPTPWAPLVANPPYSDYTSGHAGATSPFAEVLRQTLGDDTPLLLRSGTVTRSYPTLSRLEHDAFHARIWGGLHFRDAMQDGYLIGHETARQVMRIVR